MRRLIAVSSRRSSLNCSTLKNNHGLSSEIVVGRSNSLEYTPFSPVQLRRLIIAWFSCSFWQIPWVNRLFAIERHGDHPSTHQLNQRTIRIATLKNRNQRVAPGGHQKKLLHHDSLSAASFGHHQ